MGRKRMCPNPDCEKHGEPTGLLGGCECGAKLVPHRPSDQQLINLAGALIGPEVKVHLEAAQRHGLLDPYRDGLLRLHRDVQEAASSLDPAPSPISEQGGGEGWTQIGRHRIEWAREEGQ